MFKKCFVFGILFLFISLVVVADDSASVDLARVLRGVEGSDDFDYLSPDQNRRIVMLTEAGSLSEISSDDGYRVLKEIGYPDEDIAKFLQEGLSFRIAEIQPQPGVVSATWDNLIPMLEAEYPEVAVRVKDRLTELKANTGPDGYKKIMQNAPADLNDVKMTAGELKKRSGTLAEVRKFLHDQLNLNELYTGDGFTLKKDAQGKWVQGVREYFAQNKPLKDFANVNQRKIKVRASQVWGDAAVGCFRKRLRGLLN